MVRVILAKYHLYDEFKIPKSIPLLSVEENSKVNIVDKIPYSWTVKWGTLYYYNDKKKECKIECYSSCDDNGDGKKYPDDYESDIGDSDSEDDSEEEESDETEDETEDE